MSTFEVKTQAEINALSLDTSAKGRAYFNDTNSSIVAWDGTAWRSWESDGGFATGSFPSNSYSALFDGANDYIDTNKKFDFLQQTCEFSFTCWVKFTDHTSTAANQFLLGNTNTGSQPGVMCWYDNRSAAKQLRVVVSPGADSANDIFVNVTSAITDNDWHHIAVTASGNGGTLKMYKDGSLIGSNSGLTTTTSTSYHNMQIGAVGGASPTNFLGGHLDEVAFFTRELTLSEIDDIRATPYSYINYTSLYRLENNANDESGINNGTNNGATFVAKATDSTNTPY